eukprot:scaffold306_cov525-Prasinococcus_capsulatus_cf.AAC.2
MGAGRQVTDGMRRTWGAVCCRSRGVQRSLHAVQLYMKAFTTTTMRGVSARLLFAASLRRRRQPLLLLQLMHGAQTLHDAQRAELLRLLNLHRDKPTWGCRGVSQRGSVVGQQTRKHTQASGGAGASARPPQRTRGKCASGRACACPRRPVREQASERERRRGSSHQRVAIAARSAEVRVRGQRGFVDEADGCGVAAVLAVAAVVVDLLQQLLAHAVHRLHPTPSVAQLLELLRAAAKRAPR